MRTRLWKMKVDRVRAQGGEVDSSAERGPGGSPTHYPPHTRAPRPLNYPWGVFKGVDTAHGPQPTAEAKRQNPFPPQRSRILTSLLLQSTLVMASPDRMDSPGFRKRRPRS